MTLERMNGPWDRRAAIRPDDRSEPIMASRRRLLERIRGAVLARAGIVVVTGEPGAGKTWLMRRLGEGLPAGWRTVSLDAAPEAPARDALEGLAALIGADGPESIRDRLREASAEGERFVLIVDEAQNASEPFLERIRLLSNDVGAEDGPAGLVVCGLPRLLRRLSTPAHHAFRSRVGLHAHVRGLDAIETAEWLRAVAPQLLGPEGEAGAVHRDTMGNPRLLIRRALELTAAVEAAAGPGPRDDLPSAAPRPPIRMEDGMIEVGWNANGEPFEPSEPAPEMPVGVQRIDDPYAELQALAEIERIGRLVSADSSWRAVGRPAGIEEYAELVVASNGRGPRVRAEPQHDFAPFGQLFGRPAEHGSIGDGPAPGPDSP